MATEGGDPAPARHSFETLNGLRGLAALAVLLWHFDWPAQARFWHAGLSVDLFFLISGVVIAHAYEGKLRAGWPLRDFLIRRMIRLWPLYLLGSAIGFAALVYGIVLTGGYWQLKSLIVYALWSATLIPQFLDLERSAFPLNPPAWSLALEFLINIAYAAIGHRLGNRGLLIVIATGLIWLTATTAADAAGLLPPIWQSNGIWLQGLPRIVFAFPLGVLLHRLWRVGQLPQTAVPVWAIAVGFVVLLILAARGHPAWASLGVATVGWPLLVILAIGNEPGRRLRAACAVMGDISYPLYATHIGFYAAAGASVALIPHDAAFGIAALCALGCAILADRLYDRPVRRWLNRIERLPAATAVPPQ